MSSPLAVQVVLVDINPKMIKAWKDTFEFHPEVQIIQGSMLDQGVDAWVSPTNSRGLMDGGLDLAIKKHFGAQIQKRVKEEIDRLYVGVMPVGHATCVRTGAGVPKFLISTPTMSLSEQDISDTLNVALACAAAFQAVHMQNAREPGSIHSVALPGLGANTGKVPVEICADLMWTGYKLFREKAFPDFLSMRQALEAELGELGPTPKKKPATLIGGPAPLQAPPPPPSTPSVKTSEIDFDDAE